MVTNGSEPPSPPKAPLLHSRSLPLELPSELKLAFASASIEGQKAALAQLSPRSPTAVGRKEGKKGEKGAEEPERGRASAPCVRPTREEHTRRADARRGSSVAPGCSTTAGTSTSRLRTRR